MKSQMCFCFVLWLFCLLGESKRKCCRKAQGTFIRDISNIPCYKQNSRDLYSDWARNSASVPYSKEDDVLLKNSADVRQFNENIEHSGSVSGINEEKEQLESSASILDKKGENEISDRNSALTSYSKELRNSSYIQDSKENNKKLFNSDCSPCPRDVFLANLNDCECGAMCSCPISCACRQKKSILPPKRGQLPANQINNRSPVRCKVVQTNTESVTVPGNELTMKDNLESAEALSVKKDNIYYDEVFHGSSINDKRHEYNAKPIASRRKLNGAENQNNGLEENTRALNIGETKGVDFNNIDSSSMLGCTDSSNEQAHGVQSSDNYDLSKSLECRNDRKSEKSQSYSPLNYQNSDSLQFLESRNVRSLKDSNVKNVFTPITSKSKIKDFTNTENAVRVALAAAQDHRNDPESTDIDYIDARGQKKMIENDVDNIELTNDLNNENKSTKKNDSSEMMLTVGNSDSSLNDKNTRAMSASSGEHEITNSFTDDYNEEIRSKRDLLDTMETIDPQEDTRQADNYR